MKVRCKFTVAGINHMIAPWSPGAPPCAEVRLVPIWEQDGVNRQWSEATPQGEVKMMITNQSAIDAFELGKSYFVDFTPVD